MRRLTFVLAIGLALLPWSRPARALNGNEFLEGCDAPGTSAAYCMGYVSGVIDMAMDLRMACLPSTGNYKQMKDVAIKFLRNHPERRHATADSLIASALMAAFPCEDKQDAQPKQ